MMRFLFISALLWLGLCNSSQAQDYGYRSINFCLMQMDKGTYRYTDKTADGHLGAYRFDVNALFDVGACTGPAPRVRSTNWNLCDFRGLMAIDNFIRQPDDILGRGDTQDLYMDLIRKKFITTHKDFLADKTVSLLQKYDNHADLLAALAYKKGFKAVQLYLLTNVNALDKSGLSMKDYWQNMQQCGGGNRPRGMAQPKATHPLANMNFKVPLEFDWKPVTPDIVKTITAYRKAPLEIIDEVIKNNKLDGLLYDTIDLNGDGTAGMQFMLNNSYYCGSGGCMYVITEDGGKLTESTTTTRIRPAVNGVYVNGVYNSF
jgi:hypothetical protein